MHFPPDTMLHKASLPAEKNKGVVEISYRKGNQSGTVVENTYIREAGIIIRTNKNRFEDHVVAED